jgi:diadenosine tetraphosphatase ApaH/serine/threonine PP2A family protein phosphatase
MGIAILALAWQWRILAIALVVPAYYLCVHSPLHVEFRYTLAMNYFLLMLVAVALHVIALRFWQVAQVIRMSMRRDPAR